MQRVLAQVLRDHNARVPFRTPDGDLPAKLVWHLTAFLDAGRETRDANELDRIGPLEPVDPADPAAGPLRQIDGLVVFRVQVLTDLAVTTRPAWK